MRLMRQITVDGIIYELQAQGGLSRMYSELLPLMCDLEPRLRLRLLVSAGGLLQPLPRHPQITPQTVPRAGRDGRLFTGLWRQAALGLGRGRIWHSTYYTTPRIWLGPRVVSVADMIHELFPHLFPEPAEEAFRQLKRRCVLGADAVICISEATRADVCRLYDIPPGRTHVVPLAHSQVFQAAALLDLPHPLPTERPFLLFVGRRSHNKNFDGLLRAYGDWPRRNEVDMVAVGPPWTEEEWAFLGARGLRPGVHRVEAVDDRELCRLYQRASAFVYPSLYEGFGIPLLEAMACGCLVIASRIPSTLEVAGDCPIYFDVGEEASFVRALDAAWGEGRGTPRCARGEQRAARYSWQETAAQTLAVFRAL